jgi:VWFA-related protein
MTDRTIRPAAGVVAAVAWLLAPASGVELASQRQEPQRPVFRASAELVEVDVVVRDADGRPVLGLTPDDFVVLDRNRPQSIETFREMQPEPDPHGLPDMPSEIYIDVSSNTSDRADRLVVVVLDDLHVYRGRDEVVRDIARDVVSKLGPESSMALIHTSGDNNVEVTQNRPRLLAAINSFRGRQAVRRPMTACDPAIDRSTSESGYSASFGCDEQEVFANMNLYDALKNASRLLAGSDRRRKAFVLVSENIAKDLTGIFQVSVAQDTATPDGMAYATGGDLSPEGMAASIATTPYHDNAILDMMDAMRRGNVATYAIDPRGEVTPEELNLECFGAGAGGEGDPCMGGGLPDWNAWVRQAQHGLEIMSEASGGFAVVNTDDFASGIDDIITDLDYYYLLGFYTDDLESTGYRRLEVQVKGRPDLTLRYRQGYRIVEPEDPPKDESPLARLVNGALPSNDVPMRLFAAAMPYSDREARVAVAMEITVPRQSLQSENQRLLDDIEYGLFAIDMDDNGRVREQVGRGASIVLRPRNPEAALPDEVTYVITSVLQLPPGEYQLRASATSARLDLGGSVYLPFTVPDYSALAMGLTDLVLAYEDGSRVPVANSQGRSRIPAANLLPFEPVLDRVFRPSDTLRLFFQIVQRDPKPATATIQILGPRGDLVLGLDLPVEADRRAGVDQLLPLDRLAPGVYRLRVAVSGDAGFAERDVGFVIRP